MDHHRFHGAVRHILSLITLSQVQLLAAHPLSQVSLSDVEYWSETTPSDSVSAAVVYQIADGQIQVSADLTSPLTTNIISTSSFTPTPTSTSQHSARDLSTATSTLEVTVSSTTTVTTTTVVHVGYVPSFTTSIPASSLTVLSTLAVQTAAEPLPSSTSGNVITSLDTSLQGSAIPIITSFATASSSLSLVDTSTLSVAEASLITPGTTLSASDIFQVIARDAPPSQISSTNEHPVPTDAIWPSSHGPSQTNKFYANLLLGLQNSTVFTFPYSVKWARGNGAAGSWGLAVHHSERSSIVSGPPKYDDDGTRVDEGEWAYYTNPLDVHSVILSASELTATSSSSYPGLTTEALEWGSVQANLFAPGWLTPTIRFPLVQGASFVTGNYSSASPLIQTGIGFENVTYCGAVVDNSTFKYSILLANNETWLLYVTPDFSLSPGYAVNSFTLNDGSTTNLQGPSNFNGIIQVAKLPTTVSSHTDQQSLYDGAAGAFTSDVGINGSVHNEVGTYTLSWIKRGNQDQALLMFALPHHIASLDNATASNTTDLQLMTTTKGLSTAIRGTTWTLIEPNLPISMGFAPWSPTTGPCTDLPDAAKQLIRQVGASELSQDISAQTNVGSAYYDGKALAKFASAIYILYQLASDPQLALTGLVELQRQFTLHVNGLQQYPLIYESAWGGLVSNASYATNNSGVDFGNTYYNDHHFHYGYFVYTAAVIGYLNSTWLSASEPNKAWTDTLVRDYANSITDDAYFPFSRMFDWYHGHSWAAGLFASDDGKNQESSSEDTLASYALKMWGQVTRDANMEARGNLMLAVQARSLSSYYLYASDNNDNDDDDDDDNDDDNDDDDNDNDAVEPTPFIGNRVAGILFENKIDHTTYFGARREEIQGIHMIPLMPFSPYIRTREFVQQEWETYFASPENSSAAAYADTVAGGWKGILKANQALIDPVASWRYFSNETGEFRDGDLDGGASRTWYLALAAGLGGAAGG